MNFGTVMRVDTLAEQDKYLSAVRQIIGDILGTVERDVRPITLEEIADEIDISLGTISNAYNRKSVLNAMYLARLGRKYGGGYLNPYLAMFGIQAAPLEAKPTVDVLPVFCRLSTMIAEARDPNGPGGPTEVPQERSRYLPHLKAAVREGAHLAAQIEGALA